MSKFIRGARIRDVELVLPEKTLHLGDGYLTVAPTEINYNAAKLAYENRRKPWARRWLRLNRGRI
jgi:hypothetical protein